MAEAHAGYAVGNDARLRILIGIFELAAQGRPPTRAELRRRTGLTSGSIDHHIARLVKAGLLEHFIGNRNVRLTKDGIRTLSHAGLIESVARQTVYAITPKGFKLLEIAPAVEAAL
jgi:predicted transcriptional regulator